MGMATRARQRADWPSLVIHWGLVLALLLSVSTGWRIASLHDPNPLLRWVDVLVLQGNVLRWHFVGATLLVALVAGYVALLWSMGLGGRLALRLSSLRHPDHTTRWQAINKLIYWVSFVLLAGAALTGFLLYFVPGLLPTEAVATLHRWLSWGFVGYIVLHVLGQLLLGGIAQLLKIVTPRIAYGIGGLLALSAGAAGAAIAYLADGGSARTLVIGRVGELPLQLDGRADDPAWARVAEVKVHTARGFHLDGGEVDVHVRALHDGRRAWFLFRWADPTRSQKHIPLVKTEQGWKLLHRNYFVNDENEFYEDKFAVMLARSPVAGGNTVRLGPKPLADKPGPDHRLGLHLTEDGSLADVWHWKSVRTGALRQIDDNHFGPPLPAKSGRYTGGYTQDPKTGGGYEQNFQRIPDSDHVRVKWLPRNLAVQQARMGRFDPDPEKSDEGEYAMPLASVVPWTPALDAKVPVGTVIPSVIVDRPFAGDRGDVEAVAHWQDGVWTLEASRVLDTGSKFDQPIESGMFLWVAVFDHNQVRHTRHIHPLRLQLE